MRRILTGCAAALMLALPGAARTLCDVIYKVQSDDTFLSIATAHYEVSDQWTLIYYANQSALAGQVQSLVSGTDLYIPCPAQNPVPDGTPLVQKGAEMTLLTGGGKLPFADPNLPGGGLATELVNAALELSPSPVPYEVVWEDDWSRHLFPLLAEKRYGLIWDFPGPNPIARLRLTTESVRILIFPSRCLIFRSCCSNARMAVSPTKAMPILSDTACVARWGTLPMILTGRADAGSVRARSR